MASINELLSASTEDLQRALTDLGYYDGPIDGIWSPALTASIKALQADLGVPQTGVIDVTTVQAIYQRGIATGGSTTTTVPSTSAPPATTAAPETTAPPPETTKPPVTTVAPPEEQPTVLEVLKAHDDFSTLVAIIEALDLDPQDLSPLPMTVVAPTNDAFEAAGISVDSIDFTDPRSGEPDPRDARLPHRPGRPGCGVRRRRGP